MKAAILGGSFNPVHLGHLSLVGAVLAAGYDRIILVPAFQSPFKIGAGGASPRDRLDMLCASITGDSRLTVDECEIRREGVSYTIDTIADIKKRYLADGKPGLILGDDLVGTFHLWRNSSAVAQEADLIVARRLPGKNSADRNYTEYHSAELHSADFCSEKSDFPFPHKKLDNDVLDISSKMVREKIQAGLDWRDLVPAGAAHIIESRGLYGVNPGGDSDPLAAAIPPAIAGNVIDQETIVFYENLARRMLDTSRFMHSRHTAVFASDLCVRCGIDPSAGYLAGIVHDLCKSFKPDEMRKLAQSDGFEITKLEQEKPFLLHGRAAAVFLKTCYNINDESILEAVRWHVGGGSNTGTLAKIIYIADKIEVSRYWVEPGIRDMSFHAGLDELFKTVFEYTQSHINSRTDKKQ